MGKKATVTNITTSPNADPVTDRHAERIKSLMEDVTEVLGRHGADDFLLSVSQKDSNGIAVVSTGVGTSDPQQATILLGGMARSVSEFRNYKTVN